MRKDSFTSNTSNTSKLISFIVYLASNDCNFVLKEKNLKPIFKSGSCCFIYLEY